VLSCLYAATLCRYSRSIALLIVVDLLSVACLVGAVVFIRYEQTVVLKKAGLSSIHDRPKSGFAAAMSGFFNYGGT